MHAGVGVGTPFADDRSRLLLLSLLLPAGTGKTTFIKMLAGLLKPDDGSTIPLLNVSYKPQKIAPKFEGTVRQLLHQKVRASYQHPQFVTDVSHTKTMRAEATRVPLVRACRSDHG